MHQNLGHSNVYACTYHYSFPLKIPLIFSCYHTKKIEKMFVCYQYGNIFDSMREVKWHWHENYFLFELFYQFFFVLPSLPDVFFSPNKELKNKMCLSYFISGKIGKLH